MTRRILLVEDTEDNRKIVRDLMDSVGYELLEAHDGAAGLKMAQERHAVSLAAMKNVAAESGIDLHIAYAERAEDYPAAFAEFRSRGTQGIVIAGSREFRQDAATIIQLAQEARIPTSCEWAQMASEGCLLGYGADFGDLLRRTGQYVAQVRRGASPGRLPIEHPSRLEFVVNLKTARPLRLTIPPSVLARADEVIE